MATSVKLPNNFFILYCKDLIVFSDSKSELDNISNVIAMDGYLKREITWEGAAIKALKAMDEYITVCRKHKFYIERTDLYEPNPYINDGKYLDFVMCVKTAMHMQQCFPLNEETENNIWKTMFYQLKDLFKHHMSINAFVIEYPAYCNNGILHIRDHRNMSGEEALQYCKQVCAANL